VGGLVAAILATLPTAAIVVLAATGGLRSAVETNLPLIVVVLEVAGTILLVGAVWLVVRRRPWVAVGLGVTGIGVLLPVLAGWFALPDALQGALLAAAPLAVAGTAHVALGWQVQLGASRLLRTVYLLVSAGALVHLVAYNPLQDPWCTRVCLDTGPVAGDLLDTGAAVAITDLTVVAGSMAAGAAIVKASSTTTPKVIIRGALAALALLVGGAILQWLTRGDLLVVVLVLSLAFVAGGVLGSAVIIAVRREWRVRSSIERIVARLADPEAAFGDSLSGIRSIQFAIPEDGRWVDANGVPADPAPDERQIVISDRSGPIVRLLVTHDRWTGNLMSMLTPATRLALKNAQLAAVTTTRVRDVQASRRRVVSAGDTERRRIERDLHDGAQQRLVSASLHMNLARARLDGDPVALAEAEALVGDALGTLRRLAHGDFPSVLTTEGLWAALDELVRASDVPTALAVSGDDTVPTETAHAAYGLVTRALTVAAPNAEPVRVSGRRRGDILEIEVRVQAPGERASAAEFIDVDDRVGAAGGKLTLSGEDSELVLRAVLPCE
jgi:signal transduction histidine kinase